MSLLRRSSSFKRRVKDRTVATASADSTAAQSTSAVLVKGQILARSEPGKKWQSGWAVVYGGERGSLLCFHKQATHWTPFRCFPEGVVYCAHKLTRTSDVVDSSSGGGSENFCLLVESSAATVTLGFRTMAERDEWRRALVPSSSAEKESAAATTTRQYAQQQQEEHQQRAETLQRQLTNARERAATERAEAERLRAAAQRVEAELAAMVAALPHEQEDAASDGRERIT